MTKKINQLWRLVSCWFCFACFGIGGVFLSLFVFPVIMLFKGRESTRINRLIIKQSFSAFVKLMALVGGLKFDIEGKDILTGDSGCILIANHPTLIDYVVIASMLDNCDCVVKEKLWSNPFIMGVVRAAGYIPNRGSEEVIESCNASLESGSVLLVFPEGTRTTPGKPMTLQRGAANIAVRCGKPIRVVHISCNPSFLTKEDKRYEVPAEQPVFKLRVGSLMNVDGLIEEASNPSIAARRLTEKMKFELSRDIGQEVDEDAENRE